jgi:flagellar basal-body rod protein FlgG
MSGTIYEAATGALLQQMRLELLTNNLANVNTAGYKADQPVFQIDPEKLTPDPEAGGVFISPYALTMENRIDFTQGFARQTGNNLDTAIVGNGFFEVQTPDGPRYTRKGGFTINDQQILCTSDGWPVMGQGGEIQISGTRIDINDQGDIYVDDVLVDSLNIVDFPKPYALKKIGFGLMEPENPDSQPMAAENYRISQGFIETSNVDAIRTMTEMIETLRVFESYQRVIQSADEATDLAVSQVGQTV